MEQTYDNVNDAFFGTVKLFKEQRNKDLFTTTQTRNGPVIKITEPVLTTYVNPRFRTLFNTQRDCNPFFHLYEAMWMLAGRNDVAPLAYYSKQMSNYSDNGKTLNGAYGYRWRHAAHYPKNESMSEWEDNDQLKILINHLKAQPNSRRAVLQMWNVEDDLLKIGDTEPLQTLDRRNGASKDVCCNTAVYFSIRACQRCSGTGVVEFRERGTTSQEACGCVPLEERLQKPKGAQFLDMTVTNRSNDAIWGMLGANYVHFSFLQEYMAAAIGVEVGHYRQFTNDLHIYTENNSGFKPDLWLQENVDEPLMQSIPLFTTGETVEMWDNDCKLFVEFNADGSVLNQKTTWACDFFNHVAQPMCHAFHMYKQKDMSAALFWINAVEDLNWQRVGREWLQRRSK